jgi:catechol 2,3-dioxygenase-like lactoylglutathione lyase family enzyme
MSEIPTPKFGANVFEGVTPIFRVESLSTSLDYYVNVLGFKIDFHSPGIMASVSRDRCGIFLVEGDQGHPGAWVWIGVADVESLFEEYQNNGAKIRHPPTNYSWAREVQVEESGWQRATHRLGLQGRRATRRMARHAR